MDKFRVAAINADPAKPTESYLRKVKSLDCKLICFPAYYRRNENLPEMTRLAKAYKTYILAGIDEVNSRSGYKSVFLFFPDGKKRRLHRKTILANFEKKDGFREGKSIKVFASPFGKIGVSICLESWYPETPRILALKGAEIIFAPAGFGMKKGLKFDFYDNWRDMLKIRAIENLAYVICCTNAVGEKPLGVIINPEGRILAERMGEGIVTTTISLKWVRKMKTGDYEERIAAKIRLEKRQPGLYRDLIRK